MLKKIPTALYLFVVLLPLGSGLIYAFLYSIGAIGSLSQGITIEHWSNILTDITFWKSIYLSAIVALIALMFSVSLAIFITLNWVIKEKEKSNTILYIPLGIPPIIASFLSFQILNNSGLISRIAVKLNFINDAGLFPPIINDKWYLGVILTMILMTTPYFALLFINIYHNEKLAFLTQLGATLGAQKQQLRNKIIIPILLQKAKSNIGLWFIFLMSAYEIPLLLGSQSPPMFSVFLGQKFKKFNLNDVPQAYAITVFFAIFILLMMYFFNIYKTKSLK